MFIVPKDTELLIFNLPYDLSYPEGKAGMKRLEQELTKRTGVKCVVVDDLLNLGESDFEVRWRSADEPRKEANKPGVMLDEESKTKRKQRNNNLDNGGPIGFFRNTCLFPLKLQTFLLLCFFLGLLVGHSLGL